MSIRYYLPTSKVPTLYQKASRNTNAIWKCSLQIQCKSICMQNSLFSVAERAPIYYYLITEIYISCHEASVYKVMNRTFMYLVPIAIINFRALTVTIIWIYIENQASSRATCLELNRFVQRSSTEALMIWYDVYMYFRSMLRTQQYIRDILT